MMALLFGIALILVFCLTIVLAWPETQRERQRQQAAALARERARIQRVAQQAEADARRTYIQAHTDMLDAAREHGVQRFLDERGQR